MNTDLLHKDITEKVIGAAFDVHSFLGNGFQPGRRAEVIYQRVLDIYYKELPEPIGTRRADFVVEVKVLVEIKATKELEDVHMAQALNYLKPISWKQGFLLILDQRA